MPNGGSDCCGTCWFNERNKGEAGYDHTHDREPNRCIIRDLPIKNPFYTYCVNHPHRNPQRVAVPIGPVFTGDSDGNREVWMPSPDTEEVRAALLELLHAMPDVPVEEYPAGAPLDVVVIRQLGELREERALPDLERIARLDPRIAGGGQFPRNRYNVVLAAMKAIDLILGRDDPN